MVTSPRPGGVSTRFLEDLDPGLKATIAQAEAKSERLVGYCVGTN